MTLTEHLHMGGYAAYVWPAYGFTAIAVLWMIVGARRAHRAGLEAARRRIEMEKSQQLLRAANASLGLWWCSSE